MLKVLYFGRLSDLAGRREEQFNLPERITTLSQLKMWLRKNRHLGEALDERYIKTMVNQKLVHEDLTLNGDEEIGFLPPVGGG
ncbi:MAG: MoaD/ThiS family protein [Acidimicrobiales bacterium]|nr:MoaD/ThiS family protein [Hyphomonadaceae bacterium]RZV41445.1 MAG: MoaD/ThiS family protein [Acidimicrobiales bacterium]